MALSPQLIAGQNWNEHAEKFFKELKIDNLEIYYEGLPFGLDVMGYPTGPYKIKFYNNRKKQWCVIYKLKNYQRNKMYVDELKHFLNLM